MHRPVYFLAGGVEHFVDRRHAVMIQQKAQRGIGAAVKIEVDLAARTITHRFRFHRIRLLMPV
ncbi:hypothetical protein SDC9_212388 [bioreactor metagenome]|uniref:Uncharacterized protein n=1 Tax=bioreactor metagenome TaxID=1076179 RepID=A0A645JMU2_9ZZZZ